jgi:hypothetical protein
VLRGAGVALASIELLHVNTAYVRGAGGIVWPEFFARRDAGDDVAAALADLPGRLPAMRDCLNSGALPEAEPGLSAPSRVSRRRQCRPTVPGSDALIMYGRRFTSPSPPSPRQIRLAPR